MESPEQPEIPLHLGHLWDWFWDLSSRRAPAFDGLAPISYADISAWIHLCDIDISTEEVGLLLSMDDAWISTINEERRAQAEAEREAK